MPLGPLRGLRGGRVRSLRSVGGGETRFSGVRGVLGEGWGVGSVGCGGGMRVGMGGLGGGGCAVRLGFVVGPRGGRARMRFAR